MEILIEILLNGKNNKLVFIMDEKDNVLIDNLFKFYLRPIYTFVNSKHIFDEEVKIKELFEQYKFTYKNQNIYFKFLKSDENDLIQFSDVIIGLIGKMYEYINKNNYIQIIKDLNYLNNKQLKNIQILKKLINKSDDKCKGFIHTIESLSEKNKFIFLLNIIQ